MTFHSYFIGWIRLFYTFGARRIRKAASDLPIPERFKISYWGLAFMPGWKTRWNNFLRSIYHFSSASNVMETAVLNLISCSSNIRRALTVSNASFFKAKFKKHCSEALFNYLPDEWCLFPLLYVSIYAWSSKYFNVFQKSCLSCVLTLFTIELYVFLSIHTSKLF